MAQAGTFLTCIADLHVAKLPEVSRGFHHPLRANAWLGPKLGTIHIYIFYITLHYILSTSLFIII